MFNKIRIRAGIPWPQMAQAMWDVNVSAINGETNGDRARPARHRVTETLIDPVTSVEMTGTLMGRE
jgi:hypothetical protein